MDGERLKIKTVTESIYVLKCIPIDFDFTLSSQSEEDLSLLKGDCNTLLNSNRFLHFQSSYLTYNLCSELLRMMFYSLKIK